LNHWNNVLSRLFSRGLDPELTPAQMPLNLPQLFPDGLIKMEIRTIHKVKGAEFETVVFIVPKTAKNKCHSIQWRPDDNGGQERRISFVAVSRAKQRIVLCLHSTVYDALKKSRPDFIKGLHATALMLPTL
jgi:hypothetical protein